MQKQEDLFRCGLIRKGIAESTLKKLREDVEQHPVSYLQRLDTLVEALFFIYQESSEAKESAEVKKCFREFWDSVRDLTHDEIRTDEIAEGASRACALYENQGFVEGVKMGVRLMVELYAAI